MPTIFINGLAVPLPYRDGEKPGDPLQPIHRLILDMILHRRVKAKLRYLLDRGEILPSELQAKALALCEEPLKPYLTLDDDEEDPVLVEAMVIAREVITSRMAQENLPPPKNLDLHAKQLVDNIPQLQETARKRLEARYRAAQEALGATP